MKKIILLLIILLATNVYADGLEQNVDFNLKTTFYTTVKKSYLGDTTVFELTNNIPTMNLSKDQLKSILSQKPGSGSSPLTIYETLNIKVTPISGTVFDPLVGKSTYYRASSGGLWVSDLNTSIPAETIANIKNMDSDFWPYGFAVSYRKTLSDPWSTSIPSGTDLTNKTIEERLATLLDINLATDPNGVVDKYKELFYFRILPNGYNYKTRFDFYSEKENILPQLSSGSSTDYLTSSLNYIDTKYVIIKYNKTEDLATINQNIIQEKPNINLFSLLLFISVTSASIILYKKYSKNKNNIV